MHRTDAELVGALESEGDVRSERGETAYATEAHRIAVTLRQALQDYQLAHNEVVRCAERTFSPYGTSADADALDAAEAKRHQRWALLVGIRMESRRFLEKSR